jgi:hypothetical protein
LVSGPLAHTLFELVTKRFIGKEGAKWKIAQILSTQLITSPIQNASKALYSFRFNSRHIHPVQNRDIVFLKDMISHSKNLMS